MKRLEGRKISGFQLMALIVIMCVMPSTIVVPITTGAGRDAWQELRRGSAAEDLTSELVRLGTTQG